MTHREFSGVWVSDGPLDGYDFGNQSASVLLEIDWPRPESELGDYESSEEGKPYREWLIPALVLNAHARIRKVSDEGVGA